MNIYWSINKVEAASLGLAHN